MSRWGNLLSAAGNYVASAVDVIAPLTDVQEGDEDGWRDDYNRGHQGKGEEDATSRLSHQPYGGQQEEDEPTYPIHVDYGVGGAGAAMRDQPSAGAERGGYPHQQPSNNHLANTAGGDQNLINQLRHRINQLESQNENLARTVREAEAGFEASSREWQGVAKSQQERERQALNVMLGGAEEVSGLIGNPQTSHAVYTRISRAKESVSTPSGNGGEGGALKEASNVLIHAIRVAADERSYLLNGLAEILDERPPPREVDHIFERLREALISSSSSQGPGQSPSGSEADEEMKRRCAALEEKLEAIRRERTMTPPLLRQKENEAEEWKRRCVTYEQELASLREAGGPPYGARIREEETQELRRRCNSLEEKLEHVRQERSVTPPAVKEMREEAVELKRRCEALEGELVAVRQRTLQRGSPRGSPSASAAANGEGAEELKKRCVALEGEVASFRSQLSSPQAIRVKKEEVEGLRQHIASLEAELHSLREERLASLPAVRAKEEEAEVLRKQCDVVNQQLAAMKEEGYQEAETLKGRCHDLEQEVSTLRQEGSQMPLILKQKDDEAQELRRQCSALIEEVEALERDRRVTPPAVIAKQKEADELRRQCTLLNEQLVALQNEYSKTPPPEVIAKQQQAAEELRRISAQLQEELSALRQQQQQEQQATPIAGGTPPPIDLAPELKRVRQEAVEKAQEAEELRRSNAHLHGELVALRQQQQQVAASTPPSIDLAPELERVRQEAVQKAREAEQLRSMVKTVEQEKEKVQGKMRALGQEVETLRVKEKAAVSEVEKLRDQIQGLGRQGEGELAALRRAKAEEEAKAKAKEHEVTQLRVVIDQQRGLVRSKAEELERLKRESEETKRRLEAAEGMVNNLVREKDRHLNSMRAAEAKEQGMAGLQHQLADLSEELENVRTESAKTEGVLKKQVQDFHTRIQQSEHDAHELQGQLAAARADLGVLSRDYEQSETARCNLQKVLEQIQWEKAAEIKHLEKKHTKQLEAQEEAAKTQEEHLKKALQGQIDDALASARSVKEDADIEKAKAKAIAEQAKKEALSLRKALDEAISRLHSNDSDVVERKLIGNLMVSFFSQGRPKDTLDIIARTLGFTDEERKRVGLRALYSNIDSSSGGKSGLLGGLFSKMGSMVSSPRKEFRPDESEVKSLGDLWFDYLMNETEDVPGDPPILAPDLNDPALSDGRSGPPSTRLKVGGGDGSVVDALGSSR